MILTCFVILVISCVIFGVPGSCTKIVNNNAVTTVHLYMVNYNLYKHAWILKFSSGEFKKKISYLCSNVHVSGAYFVIKSYYERNA